MGSNKKSNRIKESIYFPNKYKKGQNFKYFQRKRNEKMHFVISPIPYGYDDVAGMEETTYKCKTL